MLASLSIDYRRYIAKFMHPIELELAVCKPDDAITQCLDIDWRAFKNWLANFFGRRIYFEKTSSSSA